MQKELEQKLYTRFPFMQSRCGIGCENGWFQLLWDFAEEIEKLNIPDFQMIQIKEKFSSLRLYNNTATQEVMTIVGKYEKLSSITCEFCSKKGKFRKDLGWVRTLCNKCYKEKKNEKAD